MTLRLTMLSGLLIPVLALALVQGCLDDTGRGATAPDQVGEDVVADGLSPDVTLDTATPDRKAPDVPDDVGEGCQMVAQGDMPEPTPAPRKFALSVYHFNIQYVAGGTEGMSGRSEIDFSNDALEDRIVEESFAPLLDILMDHPTWGVDVEMQGIMIDVMRERHPQVIETMRTLVGRGQLQVQSFHWSDQLWIAHDLRSVRASSRLTMESLGAVCLPVGRGVFTQEGQFGEGMVRILKDDGRAAILPKNLYRYHYGDDAPPLLFEHEGVPVIVGGRGITEGDGEEQIQVTWHFFDDGEKELTGDLDPYFGEFFAFNQASADALVAELTDLEAQGFHVTTIGDYLDHLDDLGVDAEPMPVIIDGTWQPVDSHNTFTWMGGTGLWSADERDNEILTLLSRGNQLLAALETLIPYAAGEVADPEISAAWEDALDEVWRLQLKGQVSDGTGWNPWAGEINYALDHGAQAIAAGEALWDDIKDTLGATSLLVAPAQGTVYQDIFFEAPEPPVPVDAPFELLVEGFGWEGTVAWFEDPNIGVTYVDIAIEAPGGVEWNHWVDFPRFGDDLIYAPVGREDEGVIRTIDITTLPAEGTGDVGCAAANGLLGLGDGSWILKDKTRVHLSAQLIQDEPVIRFMNKAIHPADPADPKGPHLWRFYYLPDATEAEALEFADRINVNPVMYR
ncbi:MAG: hypothetical protein ABIK09_00175 [Pseudomonadota bacterium]